MCNSIWNSISTFTINCTLLGLKINIVLLKEIVCILYYCAEKTAINSDVFIFHGEIQYVCIRNQE